MRKGYWKFGVGAAMLYAAMLNISLHATPSLLFAQAVPQEAQDIKSAIFKEANQAMTAAAQARADLLAPRSFEEALRRYKNANTSYEKGEKIDEIRADLNAATELFRKAHEATTLANTIFYSALKTREEARNAKASTYAPKHWRKAEERLVEAAEKLEGGDLKGARKKAPEVENQYIQARNEALEQNPLASMEPPPAAIDSVAPTEEPASNSVEPEPQKTNGAAKPKAANGETDSQNGQQYPELLADLTTLDPTATIRVYEPVDRLFEPSEAVAFESDDDVILRVNGLEFSPRQTTIQSWNHNLLERVVQALRQFPGRSVTVTGHVFHRYGDQKEGLRVSRERAEAVKRYLLNRLPGASIIALGYGNSFPISADSGVGESDRVEIIIHGGSSS